MTGVPLDAPVKDEIQNAYRRWLAERGFASRRGQREMIAFAARCLADGRVGVVEAGTGTGKTAAYAFAAIPVAKARGLKLVIATATVALQEQIVAKDLPDFKTSTGLDFHFALAKGRQRYVCVKRLDDHLKSGDQQHLPMFDAVGGDSSALYETLLSAFATGTWDGELDSWPGAMDESAWRAVTTDHRGCMANRCSFFRQCPYFRARGRLAKADVIIANQDLLLADLALGGGAILPLPEETQYVIDEAHHLADKTQQHFTLRVRLKSTGLWLEQAEAALGTLAQRMGRPAELTAPAQQMTALVADARMRFDALLAQVADLPFEARDTRRVVHRFRLGEVPEALAETAREASEAVRLIADRIATVHALLQEAVDGARSWERREEAEDWLPIVGSQLGRALAIVAALTGYGIAAEAGVDAPAHARWVTRIDVRGDSPERARVARMDSPERARVARMDSPERTRAARVDSPERARAARVDSPERARAARVDSPERARAARVESSMPGARSTTAEDYELVGVPLQVGPLLDRALWSRCAGALCTSATLTAMNSFERFFDRVGLPADTAAARIASPFNYAEIATFCVPAMSSDPRDPAAHTDEVVKLLPGLLAGERSALVLFTSWRQLEDVVDRLPAALKHALKVQGDGSKQVLLDAHRSAVDRGEPSYVVGVASFAEGVDLPDDYCRHVIIAKLPFAVPDEPLDQAIAEWVEARGRNAFVEISLPDAALKLVQACGRLIRHERDYGRITLLDRRIVTQRYGRALLDSLPPFKREVGALF